MKEFYKKNFKSKTNFITPRKKIITLSLLWIKCSKISY